MNIFDVLYRQARADHAKAMLKCRSESRPEALSQAEQNERFKGYEVPSTSKELEMTCLKDPKRWPKTIKVWAMRPQTLELSLGAFLSTFLIDCPSSKQNWLKKSVCSHSVSPRRMTERVRIFCSQFCFIPMAC